MGRTASVLEVGVRARFSQRVLATFGTVYLTIASIIQGATFTLLVTYVALNYTQWRSPVPWVLALWTFLIIVLLWHQYVIVALSFVWVVSVVDALIHFGLGAAEMLLVFTIRDEPSLWFGAAALFAFVGFAAVWYTYRNATSPQYKHENGPALDILGHWPRSQIFMSIAAALAMTSLFLLARGYVAPLIGDVPFLPAALLLAGAAVVVLYFLATRAEANQLARGVVQELVSLAAGRSDAKNDSEQ